MSLDPPHSTVPFMFPFRHVTHTISPAVNATDTCVFIMMHTKAMQNLAMELWGSVSLIASARWLSGSLGYLIFCKQIWHTELQSRKRRKPLSNGKMLNIFSWCTYFASKNFTWKWVVSNKVIFHPHNLIESESATLPLQSLCLSKTIFILPGFCYIREILA